MKRVMTISSSGLYKLPSKVSYVTALLYPGCLLECIESPFSRVNCTTDWLYVKTEDGITGYIMNDIVRVLEENKEKEE